LAGPTGLVFNATSDFNSATFIFATLDGTLVTWSSGATTTAKNLSSNGTAGEEFTGLAMASNNGQNYLYTADPRYPNGIDILGPTFNLVYSGATGMPSPAPAPFVAAPFVDPKLPAGFSPYNIQSLNGELYVTYVTPASGGGYVVEFHPDGTFVRQFGNGSEGPLQSPWGLALSPANFGRFSNDLLVGNFGDGRINAYDLTTGRFDGQLNDPQGKPIVIPFLWALDFGNGGKAGATNTLLFTAGIAGQYHGLFGSLQAVHPSK
jgi:uncharacterized protein (TIGR03118 family)